ADTYTRFGFPSTIIRAFCKFAFHLRRVELSAWERLFPEPVERPVITHFLDILNPSYLNASIAFHTSLIYHIFKVNAITIMRMVYVISLDRTDNILHSYRV